MDSFINTQRSFADIFRCIGGLVFISKSSHELTNKIGYRLFFATGNCLLSVRLKRDRGEMKKIQSRLAYTFLSAKEEAQGKIEKQRVRRVRSR